MNEIDNNILIENIYNKILEHKKNGEYLIRIELSNNDVRQDRNKPCLGVIFNLKTLSIIEVFNFDYFDLNMHYETKANSIFISTYKVLQ